MNSQHSLITNDIEGAKEGKQNDELKYMKGYNSWKEKIISKVPPEELVGLSKNQQKKLYKKKLFEETKKERRHKERERKKEKKRAMKEAGIPVPRKMRLKDFKDIKYCDQKIVIDLDFFELMEDCDVRMTVKQVNLCYANNRKAKFPLQLSVSGFRGAMKDTFMKLQPGSVSWDMKFEEENYNNVYPKDKLVYLSSDSDNVLEKLETDKIYVIGGLVDHNMHKGLCLERAMEKGISHAQLPIGKYVNMVTRKVLTINHVFEILSKFLETSNWKESFFSVIPKRKGMTDLADGDDD